MHSALSFLNTITSYATDGFIRYPILLQGSKTWCESVVTAYLTQECTLFTNIELYGDLSISGFVSTPMKSALKKLGQETDCLVIDISHDFNANAINAACGTVVGGGLVFFIQSNDVVQPKLIAQWLQHFNHIMVCLNQSTLDYVLPNKSLLRENMDDLNSIYRSTDQEAAVSAIKKVVTGHAKRPLIITADRGRGKSSSIGIGIAELAVSRKLTIGITAPQRASVDEIFLHAKRIALQKNAQVSIDKNQLTINETKVLFIAADELLRSKPNLDLLCVDEAAAIPAPMLLSLVPYYSRMIFSTTINGYEGTGRGFEIKFKKQLALLRPNYHLVSMTQPIRWNNNDPLEMWLSDVFLLDHHSHSNESLSSSNDLTVRYHCLSSTELVTDPALAQSVFSLLVSAHYQTSPNDWLLLLTDPSLCCWVGVDINSHKIVCCALLSKEGELDAELIKDIQLGKRRPKGHLAPVSLTQTLCIDEPALQSSMRVMRIAVQPCYQQQGIGSQFIQSMELHYKKLGVDYLSTSFGSTSELNYFWHSIGFIFARLGITKDKASGTHSLLAIKSLSQASRKWSHVVTDYFSSSLPEQLMSTFSELAVTDVVSLLAGIKEPANITALMKQRIEVFSAGGLGFELIQYELRQFVLTHLSSLLCLTEPQQILVITKIVQVNVWNEVIQECNLIGRKNADTKLREAIKVMLDNLHCKS